MLNFKEEYAGHLTEIARLGSGSACRSLYGGMVEWQAVHDKYLNIENIEKLKKGKVELSEEERNTLTRYCIANQLFEAKVFKDLNILILMEHPNEKKVVDTDGMKTSVQTSELLWVNIKKIYISLYFFSKELNSFLKDYEQ